VTWSFVTFANAVPASVAERLTTNALATRIARPLVNRLMPERPVEVVVLSGTGRGLRLFADLRSQKYYLTGTYELTVQRALEKVLRPGMTFWDIGAHVGFFSLIAARLVGAQGRVHSFEPMPENRRQLGRSVASNGFVNVTVHDVALAAAEGEATLHASDSTSEWTLVEALGAGTGVSVHCRTIDGLAGSIGPPDVIKIDVEGAEADVLRGGVRLLESRRPAIIVEFSSADALRASRELFPHCTFDALSAEHWLLR
jgi:FkbM family methyltransferase